ncbi:uncharacterized protein N7498_009278 [Penicillium cinerascens]|uniref:Uncharacterized protein n=1 Tax=Penicillium cinerascens TaxID=70096 RepID=A0A9W9J579_9EURO|nr:uncharacterized protein N7498_009278 [Penicillium cinerascens]KAJ5190293.1 hypothetical protein N7498_009278 [Penicillium cinerascens]
MRLSPIAAILILAGAVNGAVNGANSAKQTVSDIVALTDLSSKTEDIAKSIHAINVKVKAPQLISNFKEINHMLTNEIYPGSKRNLHAREEGLNIEDPSEVLDRWDVKKRQSGAYSEHDQKAVCSAFATFVQVQHQLLRTVVDKHDLIELTSEYRQVGGVLRTLEAGVDKLVHGILDHIPTCAEDVTKNKTSFDESLINAEDKYSR